MPDPTKTSELDTELELLYSMRRYHNAQIDAANQRIANHMARRGEHTRALDTINSKISDLEQLVVDITPEHP